MVNERRDYLLAFLIGAVVGVGATVLLGPRRGKKRFRNQIEPAVQRFRKRGRNLRHLARSGR